MPKLPDGILQVWQGTKRKLSLTLALPPIQIWQGTKQKDYGLSGTQLQSSIAPWQAMQAMVVAGSTEMVCWSAQPCVTVLLPPLSRAPP